MKIDMDSNLSLSARRAWIEICGGAFARLLALSSLSARRAWIEMLATRLADMSNASLSARRAWIEIEWIKAKYPGCRSLSARRAWIEIEEVPNNEEQTEVALRKESVDRNIRRCSIWVLQS